MKLILGSGDVNQTDKFLKFVREQHLESHSSAIDSTPYLHRDRIVTKMGRLALTNDDNQCRTKKEHLIVTSRGFYALINTEARE